MQHSGHSIYLIGTYRMFQGPCICWKMCTQKKNTAVNSFESKLLREPYSVTEE